MICRCGSVPPLYRTANHSQSVRYSQWSQVKPYSLSQCTFFTDCIQIRNVSPFLIRPFGAPSPRGKAWLRRDAIPSPEGKGDREAVDEEWRHLIPCNAVKSDSTGFSFVPFSRTAYRFETFRRSSSAPSGHLPPGGRHGCAGTQSLLPGEGMALRGLEETFAKLPFI